MSDGYSGWILDLWVIEKYLSRHMSGVLPILLISDVTKAKIERQEVRIQIIHHAVNPSSKSSSWGSQRGLPCNQEAIPILFWTRIPLNLKRIWDVDMAHKVRELGERSRG